MTHSLEVPRDLCTASFCSETAAGMPVFGVLGTPGKGTLVTSNSFGLSREGMGVSS